MSDGATYSYADREYKNLTGKILDFEFVFEIYIKTF